jgi:hypothetical protein
VIEENKVHSHDCKEERKGPFGRDPGALAPTVVFPIVLLFIRTKFLSLSSASYRAN